MKMKKIAAAVSAMAMSANLLTAVPTVDAADSSYNYGEALQKSMFFYEVQQSGKLPDWNSVPWREDSMVDENGVDTDKVPGGWYDAGDHFKFTLTNAYSVSLLAWGYLEYEDAVKKAGLDGLYKDNMKFAMDYVRDCDLGGGEMIGTIGDSGMDHNTWCSAEVYLRKHQLKQGNWEREYDTIKNSTVAALSAAALAQGYMIFGDEDYLKHAKDLFEGADKIRDAKDIGNMSGMYNTSTWLDDCMYAACWLYKATGDKSYLDKIEKDYVPNFPLESQSTNWKYTWGLAWDDTTQAAALLYAQLTGKEEWVKHIDKHIRYWMNTGDSDLKPFEGKVTADGLSHLTNWGCLRHACNTAWLTKLACDTVLKDSGSADKYNKWADSQVNYCFGDNKLGLCYVLGMGDKNPKAVHHRTASGIHDDHWNNLGQASGGDEGWQTEYAHTLYGALIGGPDSSGSYDMDKIGVGDYQYSEVAVDYNAGYTAVLCAMIDEYGGTPLADFPVKEEPKWAEWEVAAVINGTAGTSYTEIKAWAMNHTAWPARVAKDIEYRYYFDISEALDAGLSVDDIKVEGKSQQYSAGEQGYATVTGPYQYDGNVYYASIKFEDGRAIMPTGQSEHRDEVQFRISIPDAVDGKPTTGAWDTANDWSYAGGLATATDLKKADSLNEHITMYVNGVLVWGEEPDGTVSTQSDYVPTRSGLTGGSTIPTPTTSSTTKSTATTTTTTVTTTSVTSAETTTSFRQDGTSSTASGNDTTVSAGGDGILYGDANVDGKVTVADAVAILQHIANKDKYELKKQGKINADVDGVEGVTANDALIIQKKDAGIIDKLPHYAGK